MAAIELKSGSQKLVTEHQPQGLCCLAGRPTLGGRSLPDRFCSSLLPTHTCQQLRLGESKKTLLNLWGSVSRCLLHAEKSAGSVDPIPTRKRLQNLLEGGSGTSPYPTPGSQEQPPLAPAGEDSVVWGAQNWTPAWWCLLLKSVTSMRVLRTRCGLSGGAWGAQCRRGTPSRAVAPEEQGKLGLEPGNPSLSHLLNSLLGIFLPRLLPSCHHFFPSWVASLRSLPCFFLLPHCQPSPRPNTG